MTRTKRSFDIRPLFGAPFAMPPRSLYLTYRWCEALDSVFRVTLARDVENVPRSLKHDGYYTDNQQDSATQALVLSLTHGRFLAGITAPYDDNCGMVDVRQVYTSELDAARAADSIAARYAEDCRDGDAKQLAEMDIESAHDVIALARAEHSQLAKEMRAATRVQFDLLDASYVPPGHLLAREPSAICTALRKQLRALRDDVASAIKTIKARRENYWSAVST
jgi:hypothetical protein